MDTETQQQGFQEFLLDLNSRIRSLEGKYNLLRDRVLLINNNMVAEYKKVLNEFRAINSDIKEIKTELFSIKETLRHLIAELEKSARKEDVTVLERYINYWNPMNFVTEKDVDRIIEQKLALAEQKKEAPHGSTQQQGLR